MKRFIKYTGMAFIAGAGIFAGCSLIGVDKADMLNFITPRSGYSVTNDVAYGDSPRQKLDIYVPKDHEKQNSQTSKTHPVLIFVHGGSWQTGSKDDYVFLGESFARSGFVTVIINYHLAPTHKYPAFVNDTTQAIKWTYENIGDYQGDPNKLFAMGHSSGAFNVVTAVDDGRFFERYQVPDDAVKAVIGISGPYSYNFTKDPSRVAFPADGKPEQIMPHRHVKPSPVPHLFLVAQKDKIVKDVNTFEMMKALEDQGAQVTLKRVKDTDHISIIATVATRLNRLANTKALIIDYLDKQLSKINKPNDD